MTTLDLSGLPNAMNDIFIPLMTNNKRYLVVYGGAGSGKSVSIAQKILFRLVTEDKHRILIARKVSTTIRESVFQSFIELISSWKISHLFKINKSDRTMTYLPNASMMIFTGMDDIEKLKSIQRITSIWIEEASEMTQDDLNQLDLRLRGNLKHYKQIILTFNPISETHWLKSYFFDNIHLLNEDEVTVVKSTYLDNKFIDDTYKRVLENLKLTNITKYNIYALGEWGSLKGIIYKDITYIDEMPEYLKEERYGVDFGYNVPSSIIHIGIINQNLYVDELLYESMLTNQQLIEKAKLIPFLKTINGYFDAAEPDRIEEFNLAGFQAFKAIKKVDFGISKVQSYKLHITKRSVNIRKEIDGYVWKTDKDGKSLDEPIKLNDHAMDAMRYGVVAGDANDYFSTRIKGL